MLFLIKIIVNIFCNALSPQISVSLESNDFTPDLQLLRIGKLKYLHHPLIGYLNVNSFRNKINDLRI